MTPPPAASRSSPARRRASASGIAQIIAFAVSRPRSVSLNEILVRPTAQSG
jgi:NADP-dependent 3-hydroxy acid dehydrogenase YdfG